MAQDSDLSKTADKGKGKAVDDETQKDKAAQPVENGKKDDDKAESALTFAWASSTAEALANTMV